MAILTNASPEVTATNTVTLTNKTLTSPVLTDPTINGTTTNINTTNLVVEDKNIVINDVVSPSDANADGGGISLSGGTTKTLNWVNATSAWTSSEDFNLLTGKVFEINGTAVLTSTEVLGKGVPSGTIIGTTDTQTLINKTIDASTNTLTGVTTLTGTQTLTNKTLTAPNINNAVLKSPEERYTVSATAATGTIAFDSQTQGVLYYTTNASANFTLNFTNVNANLTTDDSITCIFLNTNGATPYYPTVFQIDSSAVTPKWSGGTAPAAGNASSIDAYSFTIIKTADAVFTVLAAGAVKYA